MEKVKWISCRDTFRLIGAHVPHTICAKNEQKKYERNLSKEIKQIRNLIKGISLYIGTIDEYVILCVVRVWFGVFFFATVVVLCVRLFSVFDAFGAVVLYI